MAERITASDVRAAFQRFATAAQVAGFDTRGWYLQEGGGGTAFGLFARAQQFGGLSPVPMTEAHGHIGRTRGEAYTALLHMARALEAVRRLRQEDDDLARLADAEDEVLDEWADPDM